MWDQLMPADIERVKQRLGYQGRQRGQVQPIAYGEPSRTELASNDVQLGSLPLV